MSWMGKLCETYDYAITKGAAFDSHNPLPEIGFKLETVQAQIRLNENGEFMGMTLLPDKGDIKPVPATPDSIMARGAPVQPHPVFDKVKELCTEKQLPILESWCGEDDVPQDVKIIFSYLQKKSLLSDIKREMANGGQLSESDDKKLTEKASKLFVTFIISEDLTASEEFVNSWKNHFLKLCENAETDRCYVTGGRLAAARKHPCAMGTSMLVSMKDSSCDGRFESAASNAVSVGFETTLKAHSARQWLMKRQGRNIYGMEIIAWNTFDFDTVLPFGASGYSSSDDDIATGETDLSAVSGASKGIYSAKLKELSEYEFDDLSTIVIMALDSATKGRASIVYYQEFDPRTYIDNLMHWYSGCIWRRYSFKSKRYVNYTPSPDDISDLIYGSRRDESIRTLKKNLCREIIPSITSKAPLPDNITLAGFTRVINPFSFTQSDGKWSRYEWNKDVEILCALINMKAKEKGERIAMILDEKETNRDYLYGRLLAIADTIESRAMSSSGGLDRMTNAMRYMQRFVQRPGDTWLMLRTQKLLPYLERLNKGSAVYYERLMTGIEGMIDADGYTSGAPLGPRFLQGFSLQKQAGYAAAEGSEETTDNSIDE